jgi:hypothetical protein
MARFDGASARPSASETTLVSLPARRSLPDRAPCLRLGAEDTDEVVAQLEGHTERRRETPQAREHARIGARERRAQCERAFDGVAAGLQRVHRFDLGAVREPIEDLSGHDVVVEARELLRRAEQRARLGAGAEQLRERHAPQDVARQHRADRRGVFALAERALERDVHAGSAAPLHVAVHPVVLDQEVALQELERGAGGDGRSERRARVDASVGRDDERGAEAFPAAQREIARSLEHGPHLRAE